MTPTPKEQEIYVQGYWVELQKKRIAGGVSAEKQGLEVGLGAVYQEEKFGLTGYLQSAVEIFHGRLQIDLMQEQKWLSQLSVGVPIGIEALKLEPHVLWPIEKNAKPKFGLRVQYQF